MENEEKSPEFGRYLRTHRRSKGISLETVSQQTKITLATLRQLEDEDLAHLPAPAFVKGFIRAYADVVGVDAQEALKRYEQRLADQTTDRQGEPGHGVPLSRASRTPWMIGGLLGVLIIAAAVYLISRSGPVQPPAPQSPAADQSTQPAPVPEGLSAPEPAGDHPAEAPAVPAGGDAADTAPPSTPPQEPAVSAAPTAGVSEAAAPLTGTQPGDATHTAPDATAALPPEQATPAEGDRELVLDITARELTWMRIQIDDGTPREETLRPDETLRLTAERHFNLFVGNAGGIALKLNGQPVEVPGKSGQVVSLQLP